jgi:hypothetical protein
VENFRKITPAQKENIPQNDKKHPKIHQKIKKNQSKSAK